MSLRRKVYVLNVPEDTRANLVSASATGSPFEAIVDGSPRTLTCAWLAKGFTYQAIAAVAEQRKVVLFSMSGDLIVNTKYHLVRSANLEYLSGRDANAPENTRTYTYTTPAVISVQATTKEAMADAFIAAVAADHAKALAVVTKNGGTSFTVTEDAGYGLSVGYPGPAFWNVVQVGTEIVATSSAMGYKAVGDGDEMLFNKAVWSKDGTWLISGDPKYNFDSTLPLAGSLYTTLIIKAKYPLADHDQTVPDLTDELILYVDEATADYLTNLTDALTVDVAANA